MPFTFGSRSRDNTQFGPASLYIGDGGQIITNLAVEFGETMSKTSFDGDLSTNFHHLGTLFKNPNLASVAVSFKLLSATDGDIRFETQQKSRVTAEFEVLELDNGLFNDLVNYAEARSLVDIIWLRESKVGEYVSFLRNVPLLLGFERGHSWDKIAKVLINVSVETFVLRKVTGQKLLT